MARWLPAAEAQRDGEDERHGNEPPTELLDFFELVGSAWRKHGEPTSGPFYDALVSCVQQLDTLYREAGVGPLGNVCEECRCEHYDACTRLFAKVGLRRRLTGI